MDRIAQIDAFFAGKPRQWVLFEAMRKSICCAYPGAEIRVMKTCISFDDPKPFCYVSLPKKKGDSGLIVTISLKEPLLHPRISMLVPISKTRCTAHIPLRDEKEIDEELLLLIARSRH